MNWAPGYRYSSIMDLWTQVQTEPSIPDHATPRTEQLKSSTSTHTCQVTRVLWHVSYHTDTGISLFNDVSAAQTTQRRRTGLLITNWEGCGRKWSWPNSRHYPGICLEGLRKTTETLTEDSRFPDRDLYPGSPEYAAGVSTTQPRRSNLLLMYYTFKSAVSKHHVYSLYYYWELWTWMDQ
jgi:hypothetical protein